MRNAIETMRRHIVEILGTNQASLYLHGSVTMDDFRPGWSDIDLLCLTDAPITPQQAQRLVGLRQSLSAKEPLNSYYRCFEGGFLSETAFREQQPETVIYWGTSGQRIQAEYDFNALSRLEWLEHGQLLHGRERRGAFSRPTQEQLRYAIARHAEAICQYGSQTGATLYSCGWLLDIARCLYTLKNGSIISKTAAGEWALEAGLCPVEAEMRRTLAVRRQPLAYRDQPETLQWLASLGDAIERFNRVLMETLNQ